jgi:exodeoxyribonuclease III
MKIISYNINGLRSGISKDLAIWLALELPDIICFQEIKSTPDQIDVSVFEKLGYYLYWNPAVKKGYSGVATFTRIKPKHVEIGLGNDKYDVEGRALRLDFETFSVLNVYMPSGSSGEDRQKFKYEWLDDFYMYTDLLLKTQPELIICGDYNICHQPIDIHNPKSNANSSGFLPEERAWMTKFISLGFVDSFRHFNQNPHHYSWWSYRAGSRGKNLGWRIDYHMVSSKLAPRLKGSGILPDVIHSDHCPVVVEIEA